MARRLLVLALAGLLGCAMRVRGVVSDAETGSPLAGAVVSSDCSDQTVSTNGLGKYDLKSRWKTCTLTIGAPGYHTRTVTLDPGGSRYPAQDVQLQRSYSAWGRQWGPRRAESDEGAPPAERQETEPR